MVSGPNLADMDNEPLYLWFAHPGDLLSEAVTRRCEQLLSEDERERWQRFRFNRRRMEHLITRTLVRTALSHYHPLAPEAWRFKMNAYGKPTTDPDCGLRFNLSNSPELVACLISKGAEVGVDIEPHERAGSIVELAPQVFSPLEIAQLDEFAGQEKLDRALSLWTLKEAYIKARGMGLSLPLNKFSFLFGGRNGIRLEVDPSLCDEPERRWRFCLLNYAGHRIALMTERATAPDLQRWEARPVLAPPARLPDDEILWFPALRNY